MTASDQAGTSATGQKSTASPPTSRRTGRSLATTAAPEAKASLTDLQNHFATLYTEVTRGDGAPTAAQKSAADTAQRAFTAVADEWRKLQDDLPELNRGLRAARLAAIRTDLPPPRDLNVADED